MQRRLLVPLAAALFVSLACTGELPPPAEDRDLRFGPDVQEALAALPRAEVTAFGQGVPRFVQGDLGVIAPPSRWTVPEAELAVALERLAPVVRLRSSDLVLARTWTDDLGYGHAKYEQTANGLPVVGGELRIHADADGKVYAVNGSARGFDIPAAPTVDASAALDKVAGWTGVARPEAKRLVYVISAMTGRAHLAWEILAEDWDASPPRVDLWYVDAHTGAWADLRPQIHAAQSRRIYDANGQNLYPAQNNMSPVCTESSGCSSSISSVMNGWNYAAATYSCLSSYFGRDSWNGTGGVLDVTVRYWDNQGGDANAFWYGSGLVLGEGNTSYGLYDLSRGLDVISHEIGHGVTQTEADLAYQNESGALNEAFSDIICATCEAHYDGAISASTWQVGEDVSTSGAMRYMANPTQDGYSTDYYPERYTGWEDNGGVHINSGIANLAYVLLVRGGSHPRNKTTVVVPALGMQKAAAIFYRALTTYLGTNSNFEDARAQTARAAADLYALSDVQAVHAAWDAVGAPGVPAINPLPLTNGVAVTGLSTGSDGKLYYYLEVPPDARDVQFQLTGSSGDADLYVAYENTPVAWDCSNDPDPKLCSQTNTSNELVTLGTATPGTWYVMVHAYGAPISGVSLTGSYRIVDLVPPQRPTLPLPPPTP